MAKLKSFYNDYEIEEMLRGGRAFDSLEKDFAGSVFRDLERLTGEG